MNDLRPDWTHDVCTCVSSRQHIHVTIINPPALLHVWTQQGSRKIAKGKMWGPKWFMGRSAHHLWADVLLFPFVEVKDVRLTTEDNVLVLVCCHFEPLRLVDPRLLDFPADWRVSGGALMGRMSAACSSSGNISSARRLRTGRPGITANWLLIERAPFGSTELPLDRMCAGIILFQEPWGE